MDSGVGGVQAEERAEPGTSAVATFAIGLGVVALLSSWTGWGGIAVGLVAAVCAVYALVRRAGGAGLKRAVAALVLAVVAIAVGVLVLDGSGAGDDSADANFGRGLTLDQCMAQAPTAKLQHVCKSQHLEEFQRRYPTAEQ